MFKTVNFKKQGGFPLTQNAMEFIQQSYNDALEAMTYMAGQYMILTGVTETPPSSNMYTDGWVVFNGHIVPFIGGVGQPNVNLTTAVSGLTFRDGSTPVVYTSYTATFSATGVPFSSFKKVSLDSLKTYVDSVNTVANNALVLAQAVSAGTQSFSPGMIVLWTGNPASLPLDWHLCDGSPNPKVGSTVVIPNLRGKFVVGYSANTGTYTMGATGGAASVALSTPQLPSHTHSISSDGNHQHYVVERGNGDEGSSGTDHSVGSWNESGTQKFTNFAGSHTHGGATGGAGSGAAHENRPPYYTLAYIVKL